MTSWCSSRQPSSWKSLGRASPLCSAMHFSAYLQPIVRQTFLTQPFLGMDVQVPIVPTACRRDFDHFRVARTRFTKSLGQSNVRNTAAVWRAFMLQNTSALALAPASLLKICEEGQKRR